MKLNISSIYEDIAAFTDAKNKRRNLRYFYVLKKVLAAVGI